MYQDSESTAQQGEFVMSEGMNAVHDGANLNPLSRAAEAALETHRMQGHVPYDPRCTICARGKSTFQHRRRREGTLETEVPADFGILTTRGEMVDDEAEGTIKASGWIISALLPRLLPLSCILMPNVLYQNELAPALTNTPFLFAVHDLNNTKAMEVLNEPFDDSKNL